MAGARRPGHSALSVDLFLRDFRFYGEEGGLCSSPFCLVFSSQEVFSLEAATLHPNSTQPSPCSLGSLDVLSVPVPGLKSPFWTQ